MNREQLHPSKPAAYRTTPLRAMEIRTFFFVVLGSPPWRKLMARFFLKIRTIENRMTFITHIWIWNDLDMIRVLNVDD